MAGLALLGDLEPLMAGQGDVVLTHWVESIKFLPPPGFAPNEPTLYGVVTQGAVARVEVEFPEQVRTYCIATSAPDFSPARPSSWSGAIDQLSAGAMPGERDANTSAANAYREQRVRLLETVRQLTDPDFADTKALAAIQRLPPPGIAPQEALTAVQRLTLVNIARYVISHELGHVIGLGHNGEAGKLMCGGPASCWRNTWEPDALTEAEKMDLLMMYPPRLAG